MKISDKIGNVMLSA